MSDAYVGEIRWLATANSKPPASWLICDGSLLAISDYEVLYVLIGTTYGGNGVQTFALPNMSGRVPLHTGTGTGLTSRPMGSTSGSESVTLLSSQLGGHTHQVLASTQPASTATPAGGLTVATIAAGDTLYTSGQNLSPIATLAGASISSVGTGSGLPHENCAPTLPIKACICFAGIYPQQS